MDYKKSFVERAKELIAEGKKRMPKTAEGLIPEAANALIAEIDTGKKPIQEISNAEFNLLQDTADRIDTMLRINAAKVSANKSKKMK